MFSKNILKQNTNNQLNVCDLGRLGISPTFCSMHTCYEKLQNASWLYAFGYLHHSSNDTQQYF